MNRSSFILARPLLRRPHTPPPWLGGIACPKILFRSLLFPRPTYPRHDQTDRYSERKSFVPTFFLSTPTGLTLTIGAVSPGAATPTNELQFGCAWTEVACNGFIQGMSASRPHRCRLLALSPFTFSTLDVVRHLLAFR